MNIHRPTRYHHLRSPWSRQDAIHIRNIAGTMMAHHVKLPWWNIWGKLATYISACAYAKRSLEGPPPPPEKVGDWVFCGYRCRSCRRETQSSLCGCPDPQPEEHGVRVRT